MAKLDDILRVEKELKRVDPNFKGFYLDIPYPHRIRKMVIDHVEIMVKMLEGPMIEEERIFLDIPELNLTLDEEYEHAKASWVTKGNKRKKVFHTPIEVK